MKTQPEPKRNPPDYCYHTDSKTKKVSVYKSKIREPFQFFTLKKPVFYKVNGFMMGVVR